MQDREGVVQGLRQRRQDDDLEIADYVARQIKPRS
jgi:hypothetical protein